MNNKQSSVEWLLSFIEPSLTQEQKHFFSMVIEQAKEMNKKQAQEYAAFCVACDRKKLPLLEFDGWIKLEESKQ